MFLNKNNMMKKNLILLVISKSLASVRGSQKMIDIIHSYREKILGEQGK